MFAPLSKAKAIESRCLDSLLRPPCDDQNVRALGRDVFGTTDEMRRNRGRNAPGSLSRGRATALGSTRSKRPPSWLQELRSCRKHLHFFDVLDFHCLNPPLNNGPFLPAGRLQPVATDLSPNGVGPVLGSLEGHHGHRPEWSAGAAQCACSGGWGHLGVHPKVSSGGWRFFLRRCVEKL